MAIKLMAIAKIELFLIRFQQVEYFSVKGQNISLKSASNTMKFYYFCTLFNINAYNCI